MSAIVTTVLKGTLGFLIKKGRKAAVERLKDGDVTNEKLKNWILDEIDSVNSKLDAMAKKDLGASISFFREGLVFLNNAMETKTCGIGSLNSSPVEVGKVKNVKEENFEESNEKANPEASKEEASWPKLFWSIASQAKGFWDHGREDETGLEAASQMTEERERSSGAEGNELSFTGELGKLNLNSLDEIEEAILDAKKRFDDARRKATEAFNNEFLTPLDRILAMGVRLMATILEKVDNPVSVLDACISGLNELHSMPFVIENFSVELKKGIKSRFIRDGRRQIISFVCQVNRTIYDFALLVSTKEVLSFWPCVEIANESVDPLRDSRVANMLRKLEMGDVCLPWSFGQEGELVSRLSIAINTLGQFLVVDCAWNCVKMFDASGKFLKSFSPFTKSGRPVAVNPFIEESDQLVAVAVDQDDNIYVLENQTSDSNSEAHLHVFNSLAQFLVDFKVGFDLRAVTVKVIASGLVLVPARYCAGYSASVTIDDIRRNFVVLKDTKGKRIGYLYEKMLKGIQDITAADDLIMILDSDSTVFVFTDSGGSRPTDKGGTRSSKTSDNGRGWSPKNVSTALFGSVWSKIKRKALTLWAPPLDPLLTDAYVREEDCLFSKFLKKFPVRGWAGAITFHPRSKHVIVVSIIEDHRRQLLFYSKEGKFERSIDIDVEQGYSIDGAVVTTDGRICIAASNAMEEKWKVLVV